MERKDLLEIQKLLFRVSDILRKNNDILTDDERILFDFIIDSRKIISDILWKQLKYV